MKKKILSWMGSFLLGTVLLFGSVSITQVKAQAGVKLECIEQESVSAVASVPKATSASTAKQVKNGLVKEGSYYRYYTNGKLLKSAWKTIGGKKYYFKSNGNVATGSYKIKTTYYVFSTKGQLLTSTKTRVVTVGKTKYYVDKNGKAVKGIDVIGGKFYSFQTNGAYDETKTKKLRDAAKYMKDFTALKKLIGNPTKTKYYSGSCFGPGKDGVLTYSRFKVYTYSYKGKVIFMGAE